jgi:predicted DNA-binding protein
MPTSVRLDRALDARLRAVARAERVPVSEILRRAATQYVEEAAGASLDVRLADVVGRVRSGGGRARRTGEALRALLKSRK